MPRDEEETTTAKPKPKYATNPFANTRGANVSANRPRPTAQPQQQQDYSEGQTNQPTPQREQTIDEKLGQQPRREAPYKYVTDQTTGLTRKIKLPGALSGTYRAPSATMEKVQQGQANWTDVFTAERERILKDPNFYKTNQITQYSPFIQQQIIADKAFDWTQVPKWQKPFYEASSRPAVAGAVQGLILGMGNPGGAVVGAAIGAAAQATGYDQTKEAWQQGDNKFTWDANQLKEAGKGAFGYLNLLAEWGEKVIGTSAMAVNAAADPNKNVSDVLNKDTFNANASFFEVIAPAIKAAEQGDGRITWSDAQKLIPALWQGGVVADLVLHPEKYKGEEYYLGASMPVELQQTWTERIDSARQEIASGRDYREVMTEMQTGIMAQIGDMAGQGVFDPLNVMPKVETGIIRKGAELSGNKPLAEAFTGVETTREGIQKFRNIVQTGEASKIDANFDAAKLNGFEKYVAGLNKSGEVKAGGLTNKGLLDPADPKKPAGGLFEETPQSRAQTGATMFDRNIGTLMTMFKDPTEAVGYIRKIAGGDMNAWKELGSKIGNSPEWYTILPALKDFSADKLEGLAKAWEVTAINRDALTRVADVLGDNPTKLIDDWAARNNTDQDFARIIQRAKDANTPESNALLKEFEAGTFTPDTLKQIVDLFHGEGALPHTEAQWKWAMYADMSDHFAEWVAQHLLLDKSPEATSTFFQTMAVLKQAQSIILLGASPGYAIQNGLSGIVHLATDGIYGSMTPRQMDDWITRWETPIPRLDEGVGIGGMVDTARSSAISDAIKGSGPLTEFKRTLSRIQRGMPMSKLSSKFESVNSKRGYVTGIKKFWANSWRRGKGFRKMDGALAKVLTDAGIDPNRIYAAIEAGANQKEIERALTGQYKGTQAKALINDAAQSAGITPAQAAEMLDTIGLTETLDTFLAGADTPDKVDAAFTRANKKMQGWIDLKYGERLATRAEEVKNIVGREGMAAGLNVAQQASNQFYDAWFDHYARFGDVMGGLEGLEPAQRSKVIEEAYRQSDTNFRRVFASMGANYQGIFEVWGLSGDPDATSAVHAISDMNNSMKEAYDFMRQKRNELSATLIREDRAPTFAEIQAVSKSVDKAFDKGFKAKHAAEIRMGDALKGVYTKLHGANAGNAAKLWWNDVMKFSEKIVADEKKFRAEQDTAREMGADRATLSDAKKKYYSENKQRWIADLQKINDEGIARLERIIKNKGGDATPTPAPTEPAPPSGEGPATPAPKKPTKAQERAAAQQEEINKLLADVEKIDAAEKAERANQVSSVWDIAEGYWNRGGNFTRNSTDKYALLPILKKPEYGGISDLMGLYDPRLDSETVTRILDTRKAIKDAEAATATPPSILEIKKRKVKDSANINILDAIRSYGGLNIAKITDYAKDKKVGSMFGVFQKQAYSKGWDITDMAIRLAGDNYPIDLTDGGGVKQLTDLLQEALSIDPETGELKKIYPTTHDYTADTAKIDAAELAHIEALKADEAAFTVEQFNAETWKARMQEAIAKKDGEAVDTLFGELPDELADTAIDADGLTYAEYILIAQNNIEADAINDARATAIATAKTQADAAVKDSETRAEAVTTRTLMLESWTEIFGTEQAQTYMEMSDAIATWYERTTGNSADEFYSRYYEEARKSVEADVIGDLEQSYRVGENVQNRSISQADAQNYARMLARSESEARSAIRNEPNKADRIAILKALHDINPDMAENVARGEIDMLRQAEGMGAKGAVVFGADGIKATIHAFEAADFSTLVHENAHVFRRVMKDVAERTGNKQVVKDLATIEEWAGVKDGNWTVPAEEKFARGFENYIATGEAPTPRLKAAFETFKGWMAQVYRTITGSAIDVKITDEVKGVFYRMLGAEGATSERKISLFQLSEGDDAIAFLQDKIDSANKMNEKYPGITEQRWLDKLSGAIDTYKAYVKQYGKGYPIVLIKDQPEVAGRPWYGAVIAPSSKTAGEWQTTHFDERGFSGDSQSKTQAEAFWETYSQGLTRPDPDLLDTVSDTDLFNAGVKWSQLPDDQRFTTSINEVMQKMKSDPLFQRNKAQVSAAQFDMFAPQAETTTDTGTTGGLLPGMQEATGMMFDVQPGGGITKMDAGNARTIYDIDPTKTAGEFRAGDIVQDADGKQHTVSGANMRSKIVTDKGRILDPQDVTRVAKQDTLFQSEEPYRMTQREWLKRRPLPAQERIPTTGSQWWIGTDDGGIYVGGENDKSHVLLAERLGIPGERITGGGYMQDGVTTKSIVTTANIQAYVKQQKAKAIVEHMDYIEKALDAGQTIPERVLADYPNTFDTRTLFQKADLPIGSIEEAGQQPPHHEAMHEGYLENIAPLMKAMQQVAREQVGSKPLDGAMRNLSPEGAAMLKKYRNQVNADMAGTKNAATKWGEQSRDFAMLNYNKRYGIDRYIETIYPYQFFYTRSLATWAARAIDKPAIFSQYARIKKQQDRYERDIPERLRGKVKISLPWLPDWMGDALYIDPMRTLFTPLNYARPFERMIQDNSYQQIEAERILQEWASDGTVAEKDIVDAIKNREGATWERAFAEAQIRRESEINNPMDFMNTMLGPAWYLTTPYKLLKGEQAGIGSTPILNTTRALDTVTQGTWAQPIGDLIGMIGKPEEMLRQKLNIPEFGEYGDYYVDRQLANMVADGLISSDEAQQAMIERTGATFDEARERVKMELAMRVPTASALLSGLTADNFVQGVARMAMTAPVSLFGAGLLPSGELEYRGLKSEWNEAWKRKDAGDDKAITAFFDDHPEYEAYLSKGKEPEERLRGYLIGQIWDGYMGLGTTDRKQATAEMGDEFQRDFLSTETRSYEGIDIEQLAAWAQMLNRSVPNTASTAPAIAAPKPQIDYYDPEITRITDKFFNDRTRMFPDYYVKQNGYYNIPESDKSGRYKYLAQNPELKQYWDWKKAYENKYPELVPIIKGQVFKQIDTSAWPPALLDYVTVYAYTGQKLPKGAYKALEQVWLSEGKPLGSVDAWLASDVAPALLYGGGQ